MHTWTSSFWLTSRELRSVFLLCEGFSRGGPELPGDLGALSPSLPGAPQGWTWRRRRVWMCWFERQQLEAR